MWYCETTNLHWFFALTVEYLASIPLFQGNLSWNSQNKQFFVKLFNDNQCALTENGKIMKFIVFYLSLHFHKLVMIHNICIYALKDLSNYVHYTFLRVRWDNWAQIYSNFITEKKTGRGMLISCFEIPINSHFWPNRKSIICQDRNKFCFMYLKLLDR